MHHYLKWQNETEIEIIENEFVIILPHIKNSILFGHFVSLWYQSLQSVQSTLDGLAISYPEGRLHR